MFRYRCLLCGQVIYKPINVRWIKYYCEVKQALTKIYRTNK